MDDEDVEPERLTYVVDDEFLDWLNGLEPEERKLAIAIAEHCLLAVVGAQ